MRQIGSTQPGCRLPPNQAGATKPSCQANEQVEECHMRMILNIVVLGLVLAVTQAQAATAPKETLFERLGGEPGITALVNDFVATVAADKRINHYFAKADVPGLKKHLVEQLCAGAGGPCTYTGKDMKTAHQGMGITTADFNALIQDFSRSLKKFKVHRRDQSALLALLTPMKKDIVGKR
ncbi:MAG: group 1 truncated hemoglobin [Methylobacteriaceae bacterium]|nr:group 1 truncated hemoglobin [Methylobacteriaceae bacterium]